MLFPRMDIWSTLMGFFPFGTSFTVLRCVFMATSTPAGMGETSSQHRRPAARPAHKQANMQRDSNPPAIVPYTTVPFLSSICTFSFESFIKNLQMGFVGAMITWVLHRHHRDVATLRHHCDGGKMICKTGPRAAPPAPDELHHIDGCCRPEPVFGCACAREPENCLSELKSLDPWRTGCTGP